MAEVKSNPNPAATGAIQEGMAKMQEATREDDKKAHEEQHSEETQTEQKKSTEEQSRPRDSRSRENQPEQKTRTPQARLNPNDQAQETVRRAHVERQRSDFQQSFDPSRLSRLPEKLGHKIETRAQNESSNHQTEGSSEELPRQDFRGRDIPPKRFEQLQRFLKTPRGESYKSVLQDPAFRGQLKQTPLARKLQRNFQQAQQAKEAQTQNEKPEVLTRSEVLQLFRTRHQSADKNRFREIVQHELAKLRKQQASQQVNKLQARSDSQKENSKINLESDHRFEQASQKLQSRLNTKTALSIFEKILQKVLKGGKAAPHLPEGVRAKFLGKGDRDWNQFYQNTTKMGSVLTEDQQPLEKLIESLFRGLFQESENELPKLVTDLSFNLEGEIIENKFAQIQIKNQKILQMLQKLNPGDVIPQDLLNQLGLELDFLKLMHQHELNTLSEQQKKQFMQQMKNSQSKESQKKLELALVKKREQNNNASESDLKEIPFDPRKSTQRFNGSPKLFMLIFYALGLVGFILFISFISKQFL